MLRTSLMIVGFAVTVVACTGEIVVNGSPDGAPAAADGGAIDGTIHYLPEGEDASSRVLAPAVPPVADSCGAGVYSGTISGSVATPLTGTGISIPLAGSVKLTLVAQGASNQTCIVGGVREPCSKVFVIHDATVTGDLGVVIGAFCTMSGALDCEAGELIDGWIACSYCPGGDMMGEACAPDAGGGGFAGPLTGHYDFTSQAFQMGSWNAAEALDGNDGGSPGPDGGPPGDYLSDSGLYLGSSFGGSGSWSAVLQ
jgi:hypothetical protein